MGTGKLVVSGAPGAPAPEAAPASAAGATGCVTSWPRSSAGAWRSRRRAGPTGCCVRGGKRNKCDGRTSMGSERVERGQTWGGEVKQKRRERRKIREAGKVEEEDEGEAEGRRG